MKTFCLILLFIISAFAGPTEPEFTYVDGIIKLDGQGFTRAIQKLNYFVIQFYTPDTPDIDRLTLQYVEAAKEIADLYPGIKVCKMDTATNEGYAAKYQITEFPSLRFYIRDGVKLTYYDGGQEKEDILEWMKDNMEDIVFRAANMKEAEGYISQNSKVAAYFGSLLSENYATFLSVVSTMEDVKFMSSINPVVKEYYAGDREDTVIYFGNIGREITFFTNPNFNNNTLRNFITAYKFPSVMAFDGKAKIRIVDEKNDAILLFTSNTAPSSHIIEAFQAASEKYREQIVFCNTSFEDNYGSKLASYLSLTIDDLPLVTVLQTSNNMKKYRLDRDITERNINTFLMNLFEKNLVGYYKTSPVPEEAYQDDVRVLVGSNFLDVALDEDKDVLAEFYSPTCKRCLEFAPIYSALATSLKHVKNLVIAKIDGSTNEVEGVDIVGFPEVKFFPRGRKSTPLTFEGDKSFVGVMEFLKEHGTVDIGAPNVADV